MTFLGSFLLALIIGGFFFTTLFAFAACARSGQISRQEEEADDRRAFGERANG